MDVLLKSVKKSSDTKGALTEFWKENFKEKQEMWGLEPTYSAVTTNTFL